METVTMFEHRSGGTRFFTVSPPKKLQRVRIKPKSAQTFHLKPSKLTGPHKQCPVHSLLEMDDVVMLLGHADIPCYLDELIQD